MVTTIETIDADADMRFEAMLLEEELSRRKERRERGLRPMEPTSGSCGDAWALAAGQVMRENSRKNRHSGE